ncbi:hypothetical protein EDD17DRAFT_1855258 [Pisolithus thermaeus]|nr:hypothetical protein EDD17DRAFT_1855258 [Pisolithus thermaeus]
MLTFTKARCNSDKENTDVHGLDGPGGRSRRPSEKLRQLMAEQQELAERREIKAQRECKRLQIRQLAQDGSETDEREGFAGDDQYGIDDGDDGSQFTSRIIMMKLSGRCKERLSYSKNKIPRVPPAMIDIDGEIAASDDEDIESHSTPHSSSDRQSTQHKKSKSQYLGSSTPPEVEDMLTVLDESWDKMAPTMKWHRESSKEDVLETTVVKAQKLVEHEGCPRTRDYNDVTQEFMMTAIGEYRACLCAEAPMPNHIAETSLLDVSWVQACKATGVNLDRTPQLAKIVTGRGSQVCGQLKTKLRPLIKAIFGFHSSQSKSAVKKNQSLAEGLKEGMNFAFKALGFLKAPLIQKIINTMWFVNKHDDSIRFHKHFKPFPYPALALVLTAIECCIDEWTMGIQVDIPFTIQEYRGTYDSHLKCLQAFEEATKTHNVLPAICMRLYEVGCIHSGAAPFSAPTEVTIST